MKKITVWFCGFLLACSANLWAQTGDIVQQFKESKHGKAFDSLYNYALKSGNYDNFDACLECHSSVAILEDHHAKMKDFVDGGKYADKRYGITCAVCHEMTVEAPGIKLKQTGWKACTGCHNVEGRNVGQQIHHPQEEMVFGYKLGDLTLKPNTHSTVPGMSCVSCHRVTATDHTFLAPKDYTVLYDAPLCLTCHKDPVAAGKALKAKKEKIDQWVKELDKEFKPMMKAHQALSNPTFQGTKPEAYADFDKDFKAVISQYMMIQDEQGHGVHSFENAETLLKYSEPRIHEITRKYPELIAQYGK